LKRLISISADECCVRVRVNCISSLLIHTLFV